MIISLGSDGTGRRFARRLLSTFGLGERPDNGRVGDCCGEDCPFHPALRGSLEQRTRFGLCCSRAVARAPIWTVGVGTPPRLSPGTLALRSSDFPLTPGGPAIILPFASSVVNVQARRRTGPFP